MKYSADVSFKFILYELHILWQHSIFHQELYSNDYENRIILQIESTKIAKQTMRC